MHVHKTVLHNTVENSSDNFPSYPPDNHHSWDDVYWRGGGGTHCTQISRYVWIMHTDM